MARTHRVNRSDWLKIGAWFELALKPPAEGVWGAELDPHPASTIAATTAIAAAAAAILAEIDIRGFYSPTGYISPTTQNWRG